MSSLLRSRLPTLVSRTPHTLTSRLISTTPRRLERILNASPEDFQSRVLEGGDKPVLVDFYADWCGPCRMLSPLLEKLESDSSLTGGKEFDLVTVNTDDQQELAIEYKVSALPTVLAFKDGKPVKRFVGFIPLPELTKFVADV